MTPRMLQVLAGEAGEFERLRQEGRFDFFASRAVKDFGLPEPGGQAEEAWRVAATARLLATEAADGCPQETLHEGDKIIPTGPARKRALGLLKSWQNDVRYIPTFERLVPEADKTIGLAYWARNLNTAPRSHASRAVEETLFGLAVERLDRMEQVDCWPRNSTASSKRTRTVRKASGAVRRQTASAGDSWWDWRGLPICWWRIRA